MDDLRKAAQEYKRGFARGIVEAFHEHGGWRGLATDALHLTAAAFVAFFCVLATFTTFSRGEILPGISVTIAGGYFFWRWVPKW
jgi:hypothetical protein